MRRMAAVAFTLYVGFKAWRGESQTEYFRRRMNSVCKGSGRLDRRAVFRLIKMNPAAAMYSRNRLFIWLRLLYLSSLKQTLLAIFKREAADAPSEGKSSLLVIQSPSLKLVSV